jgi:hypothetical protein
VRRVGDPLEVLLAGVGQALGAGDEERRGGDREGLDDQETDRSPELGAAHRADDADPDDERSYDPERQDCGDAPAERVKKTELDELAVAVCAS